MPRMLLRRLTGNLYPDSTYLERKAKESGKNLRDMTLAEMDALWDEAKQKSAEKVK